MKNIHSAGVSAFLRKATVVSGLTAIPRALIFYALLGTRSGGAFMPDLTA
jgi:hypothetical protein